MFTPSELKLIQAGQWLPELSHFVPVNSPRNLDDNLDHARDKGEEIDLFIHTALNPHAPALVGLGEFLGRPKLTILAATLRGFASIGETLKAQNLNPNYRYHLEQLKYVLTANLNLHDENPSVHLFKRLCHDAESGGSEIVRWAAAHALQELNYPRNLQDHLLRTPPDEIAAEIWARYKSRLSEQNRKNDPIKVTEDVKFGIYGHTERLFAESSGEYSFDIVCQVLRKTGIRGIRLALKYGNRPVVVEAVNFAGELFNQIDPNSQDKRYKDNATRQKLANLLLPFLNQSDLEIRNLIAENLNDKRNQYDVSNRLIDQNNRAKVAVIDTDWKRAVFLRELSIPVLCEVVENILILEEDKKRNLDCQISAIKTINEIIAMDISRKDLILSPYLQHDNENIRMEVCSLLKPHQSYLDGASNAVLNALLFKLDLPYESTLDSLDQQGLESCLHIIETLSQKVHSIFDAAISSCLVSSIIFKNFLISNRQDFLNSIEVYSRSLDSYYTNEIKRQANEIKRQSDEIKRQELCKKLKENQKSVRVELQKAQYVADKKLTENTEASNRKKLIQDTSYIIIIFYLLQIIFLCCIFTLVVWTVSRNVMVSATVGTGLGIAVFLFYSQVENYSLPSACSIKDKIWAECVILLSQRDVLREQLTAIEEQLKDNKCS